MLFFVKESDDVAFSLVSCAVGCAVSVLVVEESNFGTGVPASGVFFAEDDAGSGRSSVPLALWDLGAMTGRVNAGGAYTLGSVE